MAPVPDIAVEKVTRTFRVQDRRRGLGGAFLDLISPSGSEKLAVRELSFAIAPGEAVALIGPNGAGKSTTIKLLSGVLKPSSGSVRIGGLDPWRDRPRHVRRLGAVFGHRTQLWWDLAVVEAFDLLAAMYGVSDAELRARIDKFDALLGVGALLRTPVRMLSLGERMRCELAAALLHDPPLLFLDEPTVGLDVAVKLRLRAFLGALRDEGRTTILLTTHDLDDVSALCPRVLLLAEGRLLHDGPLDALARSLGGRRRLVVHVRTAPSAEDVRALGATYADGAVEVPVDGPVADVVRDALARLDAADLRIEEPPVEALVARFYEDRR